MNYFFILAAVTQSSPLTTNDAPKTIAHSFYNMLSNGNVDFTIIAGMLITAFSILYYIKELRGQNRIKEETLRNSAYIKDIKDSADKAAVLVKDTADKIETKLRETADKVDIKLKDTADKVDIKLKETADKALSVTNDSIETLQKKMDDFQLKFDALNKEIEKLKALINEKEESVIEIEKKIQEIKESQKKLAIYVDELLRQMIDML